MVERFSDHSAGGSEGVDVVRSCRRGCHCATVCRTQTVPDDFVITLARSTCFGECPAYSVAIDAKGDVTYEGKRFVRVEGRQTDRIPVSRVAALAATVNRISFFQLDESYRVIRRTADMFQSRTGRLHLYGSPAPAERRTSRLPRRT
jgi:hypothetical protein